MFKLVVDPALLCPPLAADASMTDWVITIRRWRSLVTHEAMSCSCPESLAARAAASWWDQRDTIVASLLEEDGPLEHGELSRIAEEISARLAQSPLAPGDEALFAEVAVLPNYVAPAFTTAERSQFREHLGDLALQRRTDQSCGAVATEPKSWDADAHDIVVEGELEAWMADGMEQDLDSSSLREHIQGCYDPAELFAVIAQHPLDLLAYPRLAVEAYAASEFGVDPSLIRFRLGPRFVQSLQAMHYEHEAGRAAACWRAMAIIAAGRASQGGGLNAHQVLRGDGSGGRPVKDDSGRTLMRGYLANNSPAAGRIHWWSGEEPEFESVGTHDDVPV